MADLRQAAMDPLRHSLLLVEDNADDEQLTVRAIMNCGVDCVVDVVRHGDDVVGRVLAPGFAMPELVLLDFHLPGYNGLEVLRQRRRNPLTKGLPVVMLSGLASNRELTECVDADASSCVQKPMDVLEYLDSVGAVVRYWLTIDRRPKPPHAHRLSAPPAPLPTCAAVRPSRGLRAPLRGSPKDGPRPARGDTMIQHEATEMTQALLAAHGERGFDVSMPDKAQYDLMLTTFASLGREAGHDGEFLMVRVQPAGTPV